MTKSSNNFSVASGYNQSLVYLFPPGKLPEQWACINLLCSFQTKEMCAAPAPVPPAAAPAAAVVPPIARLNDFLFNQGKLSRKVQSVSVIIIHVGFGDATMIKVTDDKGELF